MKEETTIREFIEENGITAKLCIVVDPEKNENGESKEMFVNEDSYLTENEDEACVYEAQDLDELIEHGDTLASILNGVQAVFYAPEGGNIRGWISDEELDEVIPDDHFLTELV